MTPPKIFGRKMERLGRGWILDIGAFEVVVFKSFDIAGSWSMQVRARQVDYFATKQEAAAEAEQRLTWLTEAVLKESSHPCSSGPTCEGRP